MLDKTKFLRVPWLTRQGGPLEITLTVPLNKM